MDPERLKANFAAVAENGEGLIAYFYADLFQREPGLRDLFPASMEKQNRRLLEALSHIVSLVDDPPALVPYLWELGRRHAGHGLANDHFPRFGVSLLTALAHFTGPGWDEDLERDWAAVFSFTAQIMAEAAAERGSAQQAVG
ncbi:globin domain-containing protein [Actinomadura rugatobispora]|uniref:Globin domain-containing protein n=1 Tax=Actinomadura rugatobispora TaxID=1994 RepID=A0ABW1A423_9ACTN|nr:hypothetical protein GCM10010200_067590 [Actinomadura rugatobispora]